MRGRGTTAGFYVVGWYMDSVNRNAILVRVIYNFKYINYRSGVAFCFAKIFK